ncbi:MULTISPECIES: hypothetical protein [Staphylococcus]|uniref:hypothetical protein n=1 Tax=Staphylococcus TaxID=1279 RepID=UPI0008A5EE15|nr:MULTISPECIES: hypothetical protein [Staphylococcus]ARB78937.1 hypothetical protein A6J61_11720 [Staphylococcus lugdunensis]ARJ17748.1 hypothetical protein B7467_01655 [Staphylococcus lugdunensis]MBM7134066.1 hypothetical protein [Staphylococcus lugdunensis]MCH8642153.1 hypothetical protein [Staphylococcus lugdunensis]MCH8644265.1 hypothetical protein [Staphylococcus lugdunensis]
MLSKQSEEFLTKLRVELLFRGKSEEQIDEIDEELRDHLTICEQQGKDVSDIIDTPVQDYANRFARHMPFANQLAKYMTYFILFMIAVFTIPDLFTKSFTLSVGYILNIFFIFFINVIVGLYVIKMLILKFGDKKRLYVLAFLTGFPIFGLMVLSTYLTGKFPIYNIVTLNQQQSIILGIVLLIAVMLACILLKQKMYALIILALCMPNIVACLFAKDNSQYIYISVIGLVILTFVFIAFNIYQFWKESRTNKSK